MKWKLNLTCSVFLRKSLTLFSGPQIIPFSDVCGSGQGLGRFRGVEREREGEGDGEGEREGERERGRERWVELGGWGMFPQGRNPCIFPLRLVRLNPAYDQWARSLAVEIMDLLYTQT